MELRNSRVSMQVLYDITLSSVASLESRRGAVIGFDAPYQASTFYFARSAEHRVDGCRCSARGGRCGYIPCRLPQLSIDEEKSLSEEDSFRWHWART